MDTYHPCYKNNSIASIKSLSLALEVPEKKLLEIASVSDKYYFENKALIKPNGDKRVTYSVKDPLRSLHQKIKTNIFHHVYYPSYLQGAIKSDETPRDYIYNAQIHSKHRFFIGEDIAKFFPSITEDNVYKIWLYFFKFSRPVAELLTRITTYNGIVPQGSKTSSYMANLLFWQHEGDMVKRLENKGITYTRFIDDITISSMRHIAKPEITIIISDLYKMMHNVGVTPNRSKHFVGSCKKNIQIHNLNVGRKQPSLTKKKLNSIRMSVYNCIKTAKKSGTSSAKYHKNYRSVMSKIGQMGRLHPKKSAQYKTQLSSYKPT